MAQADRFFTPTLQKIRRKLVSSVFLGKRKGKKVAAAPLATRKVLEAKMVVNPLLNKLPHSSPSNSPVQAIFGSSKRYLLYIN